MGTFAFQLRAGAKRHAGARAPVFQGIDLDLARGELVVLLGPSGCGKSTLLRCVAGLDAFSSGSLSVPSSSEPATRNPVMGLVFQEPRLMPWLNVHDNVTLGLRYRRNRGSAAQGDVSELLAALGLAELAQAWPAQLSGGQAQRVSLARSLLTRPEVLLLDEPFGALDPQTRSALQTWLLALKQKYELSLLFVTHDLDEALRLADRVLLMSSRPGRIIHGWARSEWAGAALGRLRAQILDHYGSDPTLPPAAIPSLAG